MCVITCNPQAPLEHVKHCPGVIIVKLQQIVIFQKSGSPAAGISLQHRPLSQPNTLV